MCAGEGRGQSATKRSHTCPPHSTAQHFLSASTSTRTRVKDSAGRHSELDNRQVRQVILGKACCVVSLKSSYRERTKTLMSCAVYDILKALYELFVSNKK